MMWRTMMWMVMCGAMLGCERGAAQALETEEAEQGPQAPAVSGGAEVAARDFMMAWVYGDGERMFRLHEDSGPGGTWCGSEEFVRSLERARGLVSPERCAEAVALTRDERGAEAGEEAVLLAYQLRLVCQDSKAGCAAWAWRVFETGLLGCGLRPVSFEIKQVVEEGERASAYVDVRGEAGEVKRRVTLVRGAGAWRVTSGLDELCAQEGK